MHHARPTFLLSPAHAGGRRAQHLLSDRAVFPLALKLRSGTATLGEVFSFVSGLYFRGKLAYARAFGQPGETFVITTNRGLLRADTPLTVDELRDFGTAEISTSDARYREALREALGTIAAPRIVFLGSIATRKYLDVLTGELGKRLYVPVSFPGMGDMRRGSILLKAVRAGEELEYTTLPLPERRSRVRP